MKTNETILSQKVISYNDIKLLKNRSNKFGSKDVINYDSFEHTKIDHDIDIIKPTENQKINSNSNIIKITKNNVKPTKKLNHEFRNEHQNIASQPSKTVENSTEILENPAEEYSADYVIVNGKKIYNEEEAIDITKEAFQLFASNVTKTINQAEPIKNLSINF